MEIILYILLTAIGGVLYHLGGIGRPFNTKYRDLGLPTIMVAMMWVLGDFHWTLAICFCLMFGALTTYWDFVNKWFNVQNPDDEYWWNWALHAFFINLAMLPLVIATGLWSGFILRAIILTVTVALWSDLNDDVTWEEVGRGVLIIGSLPLI